MAAIPRLLTIAGSDSGGGAGIQADLKTFAAHGAFGMSAIVALTAQNTCEVRSVHGAPAAFVAQQIDAVFEDLGVDGVKIGMLATSELVRTVADRLRVHAGPDLPIVLDPVMIAKSGARLLAEEAIASLREELLPLTTIVTPNLPELAELTGLPVATEPERLVAAVEIAALGPAVLVKGGHGEGGEGGELVDLLWTTTGVHRFAHPRIATTSTHGTGCTLSSAIAARLARGERLDVAVGGAIDYLRGAIRAAYPLGHGAGPVDHLYRFARGEGFA
ncbi:MAG TPA: bifunctional hydroxymethylpyrimidine kinase/phosphomethylpyrimidine kinase [Thermoanaerobaculia bacterium]|jgi:hydroxymethylpyrimidine/phosphomethylpyrimidine kinase|nr:bifunctional hydroxymethylpyrimidine kinase/phosphomethylpyrimidine kinase [Thermoanaerobaculia bacterium]